MPYTKQGPFANDTTPPVNATRLNNIEDGIDVAHDNIDGHIADSSDAHDASAISFTPTGTLSSTDVQAAIAEAASEGGAVSSVFTRTGAVAAASGDYTASQVTNTPAGNIAATTAQGAINELDAEKTPTTTTISTTAPLAGGGDLSANRTLTVGAASETATGVAELATQAETDTGTDDARFVTPLKLATTPLGMLNISRTEVSITGATTLTSTAFGKMHVCSGTSADYTVTLPAASLNAGKVIGFRMANALTKLVTLDGNASETIDGATTRVMWAQESATLLCDGTSWTKIAGRFRPMIGVGKQTTAQSIPVTTTTNLTLEAAMVDIGSMVNVASDNIGIRRAGTYLVGGELTLATGQTATRIIMLIAGSGGATVSTEVEVSSTATQPQLLGSGPRSLAAAETVVIQVWHNSAAARSTVVSAEQYQAKVMIEEMATW